MRTWTADELAAFLRHVGDERLYAGWLLAATTGARRGEILGARWRDVDLDRGRWSIVQTVIEAGVSRPKSGRSRSVALDAGTIDALRTHRKAQAAERLAWGAAYSDHGLAFCREDGTPLRPRSFSRMFDRHVELAGLPRIRLHDPRHTWATLALGAGVHRKIVSAARPCVHRDHARCLQPRQRRHAAGRRRHSRGAAALTRRSDGDRWTLVAYAASVPRYVTSARKRRPVSLWRRIGVSSGDAIG